MTEALSHFINDAGWLAPLYYVLSFVVTALLPFIPTPLVGALGGAAFGTVAAIGYGVIGLGLGAFVALNLSRRIGRPVVLRLVTPRVWAEWEALLGIRSAAVWGLIFFLLNVDFAVVAAGLSQVPVRRLWVAAMIARFPWLVVSAFFGDLVFVSDTVMVLSLVVMLGMLVVLGKVRPRVHAFLVRWAARFAPPPHRARAGRRVGLGRRATDRAPGAAADDAAAPADPSHVIAPEPPRGTAQAEPPHPTAQAEPPRDTPQEEPSHPRAPERSEPNAPADDAREADHGTSRSTSRSELLATQGRRPQRPSRGGA